VNEISQEINKKGRKYKERRKNGRKLSKQTIYIAPKSTNESQADYRPRVHMGPRIGFRN